MIHPSKLNQSVYHCSWWLEDVFIGLPAYDLFKTCHFSGFIWLLSTLGMHLLKLWDSRDHQVQQCWKQRVESQLNHRNVMTSRFALSSDSAANRGRSCRPCGKMCLSPKIFGHFWSHKFSRPQLINYQTYPRFGREIWRPSDSWPTYTLFFVWSCLGYSIIINHHH